MTDDPGGDLGTDAADSPAGQVLLYLYDALGHHPFQKFRFELAAVAGMTGPLAGDHQPLAGSGQGNGAYHGDGIAVITAQPQHGITVFVILKNHTGDGALQDL